MTGYYTGHAKGPVRPERGGWEIQYGCDWKQVAFLLPRRLLELAQSVCEESLEFFPAGLQEN